MLETILIGYIVFTYVMMYQPLKENFEKEKEGNQIKRWFFFALSPILFTMMLIMNIIDR